MSQIKEIHKFVAQDGREFGNIQEARKHQARIALRRWVDAMTRNGDRAAEDVFDSLVDRPQALDLVDLLIAAHDFESNDFGDTEI